MALAILGRPWGRRGEVAGISLCGGPERFEVVRQVTLFPDVSGEPRTVEIESVWQHRGQLIFKFRGIDSIDDAEKIARHEVRVPFEQRAVLPEGEYYHSDLVGCEMIERSTGAKVGVVKDLKEYGGPALLEVEVEGAREPLLVPFAKAICVDIDPGNRRIVVDLPEGLKDL